MSKGNNKKGMAISLRLQGKSYDEILKILGLSSKSTLNYWFKGLQLSPVAKKTLEAKKMRASKENILIFNNRRTKEVVAENKKIFGEASKKITRLSKNEILLIGTALYWGEGTLRSKKWGYQSVSFSNSDPLMVKVFMRYLRETLDVPEDRIKARIQIHANISVSKAINFWSRTTELPKSRFYIGYAISSASKLKRPINFLPYGTLNIRVNNRKLFYRVKGYIQGIVDRST